MKQILKKILHKTRLRPLLRSNSLPFTNQLVQYKNYEIADWTYGSPDILKWDDATTLTIGRFCSIAKGVRILVGGEHHLDWVTTYPLDLLFNDSLTFNRTATKGNITIGNDVWIGTNTTILSGVTIGDGAVIGAGSVVSRDIDPYTIAAGNPAKPIRKRFEDPVIQALLTIKWWDWPMEKIREEIPLLLSGHLAEFLTKHSLRDASKSGVIFNAPENQGEKQSAV